MKATKQDALMALETLEKAGFEAYLAGGCVRDTILGLEPNDYDVTTSAIPEQIRSLFPKTLDVGESFGVVKIVVGHRELDVATFRVDGEHTDYRRPKTVTYATSAEEDVKRRDFTINALLMKRNGEIIDYVGGTDDLKNGILRTVGSPQDRFSEDALRMMRAIRFSIRYGLEIEVEAWKSIQKNAHLIDNISKERITDEFLKILSYGKCDTSITKLIAADLLSRIMVYGYWNQMTNVLSPMSRVSSGAPPEVPITVLMESGNVTTDKLVLPNALADRIKRSRQLLGSISNFSNLDLAHQRLLVNDELMPVVEQLMECYAFPTSRHFPGIEVFKAQAKPIKELGFPDPLINGDTLLSWGYQSGPAFTIILKDIRERQLNGTINSIDEARDYIESTYKGLARLVHGVLVDASAPKTVAARCTCGIVLTVRVPKTIYGKEDWARATDRRNISHTTSVSVYCDKCWKRVLKRKFKPMVEE